jgi:hypothetical protein
VRYPADKSNIQYLFWGFLIIFLPISMMVAKYEQKILHFPFQFVLFSPLSHSFYGSRIANSQCRRDFFFEETPARGDENIGKKLWMTIVANATSPDLLGSIDLSSGSRP